MFRQGSLRTLANVTSRYNSVCKIENNVRFIPFALNLLKISFNRLLAKEEWLVDQLFIKEREEKS
jgi:hypothetical protein